MRTENSIKNSLLSVVYNVITILVKFVAQAVFIKTLSSEYNGLKSLFLNILSMLSITELGFGTAIIYNLYRPVKDEDYEEIKTLVKTYQKVYRLIGSIVLAIGILLLTLIPAIVGETNIQENIYVLFLLFLLKSVFTYLLCYKQSILYADQKNYIISIINIVYIVLVNVLQVICLIITKNFYLYLIIDIICVILQNLLIQYIANKRYPYLKDVKNAKPITKEKRKEIITGVKGLIFHKIGDFVVNGTDNIIIATASGLGIVTVGLYSNYTMIVNSVNTMFGSIITSLKSSIGNLLVSEKEGNEKRIYIFKAMLLANSWLYCFCSVTIYVLIEPFITLWIGSEYILPKVVLIVLVSNLYVQGMRKTADSFKEAAGIFYEDRYVPLIEALINLIASLIFVKLWGLQGVILGTILSTSVLYFYTYPKFVFKRILKCNYLQYLKLYGSHFLNTIIIFLLTAFITEKITISNVFFQLLVKGIVCIVLINVLSYLFAIKRKEFKFFKDLIRSKLQKFKK